MRRPSSPPALPELLTALLTVLVAAWIGAPAAVAADDKVSDVYVSEVVVPHVLDVDLRQVPPAPAWQPGDPIEVIPEGAVSDSGVETDPLWNDPVRQLEPEGVTFSTSVLVSFPGIPFTGATPPDTVGDVGPNHYIQMVNASRFAIWDKQGGVLVPSTDLSDLWTGGSSPCQDGDGDPIVQYDDLADRWLMTEFDPSGNTFCLYVSQTPAPVAGGWFVYDFSAPSFPDYPKYGVWPDLYVATANQGNNPPVYAFDRLNMLSPNGTTCPTARPVQKLTAPGLPGLGFEAFTPADVDGPPPPAGAPAIVMRHRDEELNGDPNPDPDFDPLEIWAFDVDFDNPGNTTLTQLPNIILSDFDSNLCPPINIFSCIPQPGGGIPLDPLLEVIMFRLSYRNFGTHETLVGVLQTDVNDFPDHSAERWFELRKVGLGDWTLFQEGTYSPDLDHRFMGMVAMDVNANILLSYNVSSEVVFPSIRYTGRLATDPPGVMTQPEITLAPGGGINGSMRYGDYNQMGVDPIDGCTFWFLGMYNPNAKGVRVGAVKFDSCESSQIFADGFESGDTSAWSAECPPDCT